MTKTIAEQLVEAIVLQGWIEQKKQAGYRVFEKHGETLEYNGRIKSKRYFVGPNGALRVGVAPSSSRSLTDTKFYRQLLGIDNLSYVELKLSKGLY